MTIFAPSGILATIQSRASARVSGCASTWSLWMREHEPLQRRQPPITAKATPRAHGRRTRDATPPASATAPAAASRHSSG